MNNATLKKDGVVVTQCRAVSVAVSRKQYVAVDAISDLENGVFP